jgi:hypothetical protein
MIAKKYHQDFTLLHTIILVKHHFFLMKSGAPLVCFHPLFNWPTLWRHGLMNFKEYQNPLDFNFTPNKKCIKMSALLTKLSII